VFSKRTDVAEGSFLRLFEIAQHRGGRHDGGVVVRKTESARRPGLPLALDLLATVMSSEHPDEARALHDVAHAELGKQLQEGHPYLVKRVGK